MVKARIYRPSKSAMQSGRGGPHSWILEYESEAARVPEPLMGWIPADDTLGQVRIGFSTLEEAHKFAEDHGISCSVVPPHERKVRPRNYGDNFRYVPPDEKNRKKS